MQRLNPLYEYGGTGPVIHMGLANGFPPETYKPLLDPFTKQYRVVSLLPRPLWPAPPAPEDMDSWEMLAEDFLEGLYAHQLGHVIAVGHSLGGLTSALAVTRDPDRFRALVLVDPTFLPPWLLFVLRWIKALGQDHRYPLVQKALQRRARFASEQEAFTYWRQKSLFRDWSDETLWYYVQGMTKPAPDGTGLILSWSPQWESRIYQTAYTAAWQVADRLRGTVPMLLIRGEHTNTFRPASQRAMLRRLPDITTHQIDGHGHLFPHTAPDETHRIIMAWLDTLPG
jgi:pimeloyl-ACP methyl ester carboxylesterase